jgi:phage FluMu protein Com
MSTMDERPMTSEGEGYELRDERCECGNLLCKISAETVEIKCRRCKRIHIIPIKKLVEQEDS